MTKIIQPQRNPVIEQAQQGVMAALMDSMNPDKQAQRETARVENDVRRAAAENDLAMQEQIAQGGGTMAAARSLGVAPQLALPTRPTNADGGNVAEVDPMAVFADKTSRDNILAMNDRAILLDQQIQQLQINMRSGNPQVRQQAASQIDRLSAERVKVQEGLGGIASSVVDSLATMAAKNDTPGILRASSAILGKPVLGFGETKNGRLAMVVQDDATEGAAPSIYEVNGLPATFFDDLLKRKTQTTDANKIDANTGMTVNTREVVRPGGDKTVDQTGDGYAAAMYRKHQSGIAREEAAAAKDSATADYYSGAKSELAAARAAQVGQPRELTPAQQRVNLEIQAARDLVGGLPPEELRRLTATKTDSGRDNPDYSHQLAAAARLEKRRKTGADDVFDQRTAPQGRQTSKPAGTPIERARAALEADPNMAGLSLGKQTLRGFEVLDADGRLVGHFAAGK